MEVIDRKENSILNRVEISWQWRHVGAPTPTRGEIISAVVKLEPGAKKDLVLVKSVNTRFGQPLTTGNAFIYSSRDDLEKEPKYILERHAQFTESSSATEESAVEEPADVSEDPEIAGGEE